MKLLILNGPNLNLLGQRDPMQYGTISLLEIEESVRQRATSLGVEIQFLQSNWEGQLIDWIQQESKSSQGIIINPGALTHYSLSLRDALADCRLPVIEVHLSNIYARETWRARSVIAPVANGYITGLGWRVYQYALEYLVSYLRKETEKP